ncbi:MAG TPA: NADH-quinone oxidoreductase subunit NuoB [Thermoanaerobaculia bacterium]
MEDVPPTTAGPPEPPVLTTTWDRIFDWARRLGVRPVLLGTGCCAFEMLPGLDPRHDLARFGPEVFRAAPGKSDLLVVAGPVSRKMAPLVRRIWDEMPDPKWSIALGSCAGQDGPWRTYAVTEGLESVIPVDVHVPGCPPGAEALLAALLELEKKIRPQGAA